MDLNVRNNEILEAKNKELKEEIKNHMISKSAMATVMNRFDAENKELEKELNDWRSCTEEYTSYLKKNIKLEAKVKELRREIESTIKYLESHPKSSITNGSIGHRDLKSVLGRVDSSNTASQSEKNPWAELYGSCNTSPQKEG